MNEIEILMLDGCTRSEAEKHLKNGTVIFTDLAENLESYLDEWDVEAEDRDKYHRMVNDKIPARDWGIVEDNYIMYIL